MTEAVTINKTERTKTMKQPGVISEGAKLRLFKMAMKANDRLESCDSDEEYAKAKTRSDQWNEIVMALGLSNELKKYYAQQRGEDC